MMLTPAQHAALVEVVKRVRADGPHTRVPYGAGTWPMIRAGTAIALRDLGLVTLHTDMTTRPAKAGFGHKANWKTVLSSSAWMEPTETFMRRLAKMDAKNAGARPNPAGNDPHLTVAKLHLRRIAPGAYEHVNRATGTTWSVFKRESRVPSWTFRNTLDNREGGADVFPSKSDASLALVHYLRGRYFDDRFGWCTR
jgi:hypothetical protein